MWIEITRGTVAGGERRAVGAVIDLDASEAQALIRMNRARAVEAPETAVEEQPETEAESQPEKATKSQPETAAKKPRSRKK
jgi:hypothetical protein